MSPCWLQSQSLQSGLIPAVGTAPLRLAVDKVLVSAAADQLHDQAGLLERDAGLVGERPDVALRVLSEAEHERVAVQWTVRQVLDSWGAVLGVAVVLLVEDEHLPVAVADAAEPARVVTEDITAPELPQIRVRPAVHEATDYCGALVVVVLAHRVPVRRLAPEVGIHETVGGRVGQGVEERVETEGALLPVPAEVHRQALGSG